MKQDFFNNEELEALKGGLNEAPIKAENEVDDEENGALISCCSTNQSLDQMER